MSTRNRFFSFKAVCAMLGISALMLCCFGALAQEKAPASVAPPAAQPGPGAVAPPATENQGKVWELQAKYVAQDLGLSPDLTTKLTDAYKAARDSQLAALRAKQGEGGDRRNMRGAMQEVNTAEKAKLETALKGFLNPEQTTKALAILGTFNRRWDRMVTILDAMNLAEKPKTDAMKLVANYVVETDTLMQSVMASGDFQSVREKSTRLKEQLDGELGKVLSAEQLAKWKEATVRGGGQRGGFGGQPGGAPQPAPAPAPAPK